MLYTQSFENGLRPLSYRGEWHKFSSYASTSHAIPKDKLLQRLCDT
jgi:hypothetical protein